MIQRNLLSTLFIVLFVFGCLNVQGQGRLSFGANYLRPLGLLEAQNYGQGGGVSMEVFTDNLREYRMGALQLGVHLDASFSGTDTREVDFFLPMNEPGELKIANESYGIYGMARFITPEFARMKFYVDGIMGSRRFSSIQYLTPDAPHYNDDDCPAESETLEGNWTFLMGASGGLQFRINHEVSIDLRATYTRGSNASFIDLGTVGITEQNTLGYQTNRAASELLSVSVGVSALLGPCTPSRSSLAVRD